MVSKQQEGLVSMVSTKKALHKKCPVLIMSWPKLVQFRRGTRLTAKGYIPGVELGSTFLTGQCKEGKRSMIEEGAEIFSHLAKKCAYCFDPLVSSQFLGFSLF